LTGKPTVSFT